MNTPIIKDFEVKNDKLLQKSAIEQAVLRFLVGLPFVTIQIALLSLTTKIQSWAFLLVFLYIYYIAITYYLARYKNLKKIKQFITITAIIDPFFMSAWLILTNDYGSLVVGFYLFTILGYGFRINPKTMYVCQIFSIIGFIVVLVYTPFWHNHKLIWVAFLVPLVVVPVYATKLIRKLREAQQRAEQESKAKSELLARVSHELRTPLTGIIAATELLSAEVREDSHVSKRTETILTLSNELLHEINDLLDEAKYGENTVTLSFMPVNLHELAELLQATLESMAIKKGLLFQVHIDSSITSRVNSDFHHLARVLLNLAGNAIKFTDSGSVSLKIELVEEKPAHYQIRFSVTDTGIGIPDSFRATIFQPFSQVEQGTHRRYGGTGLGLALSKKIVGLMDSDLQFASTLGEGSRFWFDLILPRVECIHPIASEKPPLTHTSPKRILVVEDNVTNLLLLEEMLKTDQHQVTTCMNGMTALELLSKQSFDVILLDYNLGDMDGVRVLQTYQFGCLHPAPVLFLTADATHTTASRLKSAGGAGVLHKPIRLAALRKSLLQFEGTATSVAPYIDSSVALKNEETKATRPTLSVVPVVAFDQELLDELRAAGSRPEFLVRLLAAAEQDITRCCQRLLDALSKRNQTEVREAAHALKGVCANIGAVRLLAVANNLMTLSSEEWESARERLQGDIREASRITLQALETMMTKTKPNSGSPLDTL